MLVDGCIDRPSANYEMGSRMSSCLPDGKLTPPSSWGVICFLSSFTVSVLVSSRIAAIVRDSQTASLA